MISLSMRVLATGLLLTTLTALSCRRDSGGTVSPNDFADGLVATVNNVSAPGWPQDQVTVDSTVVTGDTLRLFVHHGGGCRTHRFALLLGSAFMESHPVQVHARLAHDAAGDMCRAIVFKALAFDLRPLKTRYRASYGGGAATIVINLVDQSRSIRYSFE